MRKAVLLVLALAGCSKHAPPPPPVVESPESVYGRMRAAVLSGDAKVQWEMFSAGYKAQAQRLLEDMKKLPDDQLASVAKAVGTTAESVRAMTVLDALDLKLRTDRKDAAKMSKYRDLGSPTVFSENGKPPLHVVAKSPDGTWSYEVVLVEESGQWKVEREEENDMSIEEPGK